MPTDAAEETILAYDGSFPGFLCALAESLNRRIQPRLTPVVKGTGECSLVNTYSPLSTPPTRSLPVPELPHSHAISISGVPSADIRRTSQTQGAETDRPTSPAGSPKSRKSAAPIHSSRLGGRIRLLDATDRDAAGLFGMPEPVLRDDTRAARLWERFGRRLGQETMRSCLEAFCADTPGREEALLQVMCRLPQSGPALLQDLADPDVLTVFQATRRTRMEAHRFLGILRFSELEDGTMYAPIEPDCDILALIAGHFASRFPYMDFVIHDLRRHSAVIHPKGGPWRILQDFVAGPPGDKDQAAGRSQSMEPLRNAEDSHNAVHITNASQVPGTAPFQYPDNQDGLVAFGIHAPHSGEQEGCLPLSENELELREGWMHYFSSVSIASRKNLKAQRNHLPLKYRQHLPEMGLPATAQAAINSKSSPDYNQPGIGRPHSGTGSPTPGTHRLEASCSSTKASTIQESTTPEVSPMSAMQSAP